MILSSSFSLKESNKTKLETLSLFKKEYSDAIAKFVDYLWNTRIELNGRILDVAQSLYNCPTMLPNKPKFNSRLSARALSCAATQACGIVNAVLKTRIKQENKLTYCKQKGYSTKRLEELLKSPPTKPIVNNINPELNSIIVNIGSSNNSFDMWLNFGSLFNDVRGLKIAIPLKNHRHSNKLKSLSVGTKSSILLCNDSVKIRYEIPNTTKKDTGDVMSIDQGVTDLITTNRNDIIAVDKHNWTLIKILKKMAKCSSGSLAFKKSKEHLKNYINYVMKRIDLSDVKEVKFEDIFNIKYGSNVSRILKHWSNPLIRESLFKVCESKGVLLTFVPNEYNSQRCNVCGWTQKSNRKGKVFKCLHCGSVDDADHNASLNILTRDTLPDIPFGFRNLGHNKSGFFWNVGVLCNEFGEEITVPQPQKQNNI